MSLDAALSAVVHAEVQRQIAEIQRPELVHQRSVAAVVGMPARDYLRHCREGDWPSWGDRRLRFARTADVVAWVQAQSPTVHTKRDRVVAEFQRSRSGLRRVG